MGDLNAGVLTLLAFLALAVFGVIAFFSLRKHVRGIQAPHKPALPKAGEEFNDPLEAGRKSVAPKLDVPPGSDGLRSPKASGKS